MRRPADAARDPDRCRMGCAVSSFDSLGRIGPAESGDPGDVLCVDRSLRADLSASAAKPGCLENARAGFARHLAALARHGAHSAFAAGYLAQPSSQRVLSGGLGSPAECCVAAQLFLSARCTLQHAIPELSRQPYVAELSGGRHVADEPPAAADVRPSRGPRYRDASAAGRCGPSLGRDCRRRAYRESTESRVCAAVSSFALWRDGTCGHLGHGSVASGVGAGRDC